MKFATKKQLQLLGWFLLLAAGALAFLWFYWLAPMRHLIDSNWWSTRSMYEVWIEAQKQIHRTGVDHDTSVEIGRFGDKTWTEWTIRKLNSSKQEKEMYSCGEWPYHLESALCDLTNQRMSNNVAWVEWWDKNKNKSQADWIREGFAQIGLILQCPLTTNNIIDLLKLVQPSTNFTLYTNKVSSDARSGLHYNALRWLRDSGFRWNKLDLNTVPPENKDGAIIALMGYAEWHGKYWNAPGKLSIGHEHDYDPEYRSIRPAILWAVYLSLPLLTVGGISLLLWSRRKECGQV